VNPAKILMKLYHMLVLKLSKKIANWSFEDVVVFKYFGTKFTDQNCVQKEITAY
jgi:hypothetical protein